MRPTLVSRSYAGAPVRARPRAAALAVVAPAGISLGYGAYVLTVVAVPL